MSLSSAMSATSRAQDFSASSTIDRPHSPQNRADARFNVPQPAQTADSSLTATPYSRKREGIAPIPSSPGPTWVPITGPISLVNSGGRQKTC